MIVNIDRPTYSLTKNVKVSWLEIFTHQKHLKDYNQAFLESFIFVLCKAISDYKQKASIL